MDQTASYRIASDTITDARGRRVTVLNPLKLHLLGRDNVVDRASLEEIAEELEPGRKSRRLIIWWLLPALVVLMVGGLALMLYMEKGTAWDDLLDTLFDPTMITIWVASLGGGVIAPYFAVRGQRLRRTPAVMLKHRCCPHCGYGLRGVPVDPMDGATVCPECASAWRLDVPEHVGAVGSMEHDATRSRFVIMGLLAVLTGTAVFGALVFWLVTRAS